MRAGIQGTDGAVGVAWFIISFMVISSLKKFGKTTPPIGGCFPDGLKKCLQRLPQETITR